MYDLIIIGAGPAGIAAGIQATRVGLKTLLLEKDRLGGQVKIANLIENFPGLPSIKGGELARRLADHIKKTKIEVRIEKVVTLKKVKETFAVKTKDDDYKSKAVIIATGAIPRKIECQGAAELENKKLFYYADPTLVQHKKKDIMIIGSGDAALDQALNFSKMAKTVTIYMRTNSPKALPVLVQRARKNKIKIYTDSKIVSIENNGKKLVCECLNAHITKSISTDIIIACIGKEQASSLVNITNPPPGVFTAGDCCHPSHERYIPIAMRDGMLAVHSIIKYY